MAARKSHSQSNSVTGELWRLGQSVEVGWGTLHAVIFFCLDTAWLNVSLCGSSDSYERARSKRPDHPNTTSALCSGLFQFFAFTFGRFQQHSKRQYESFAADWTATVWRHLFSLPDDKQLSMRESVWAASKAFLQRLHVLTLKVKETVSWPKEINNSAQSTGQNSPVSARIRATAWAKGSAKIGPVGWAVLKLSLLDNEIWRKGEGPIQKNKQKKQTF